MSKTLPFSLIICFLLFPNSIIKGQNADTVAVKQQYGIRDLWGVGLRVSTDGISLEAVKGFGDRLNLRLGYSMLSIPISQEVEMEGFSAKAEAKLKFGGANLFVDYYLVKNVVHLTGGVMYNTMNHTVTLTPTSDYPYGEIMVPPSDIGFIEAVISPGIRISPYLAVGFGNTLSREHKFSFNFEIGTLYHGAPKLDLSGTNMLSLIGGDNNELLIRNAIAQYKWYPMVSMQLTYRII